MYIFWHTLVAISRGQEVCTEGLAVIWLRQWKTRTSTKSVPPVPGSQMGSEKLSCSFSWELWFMSLLCAFGPSILPLHSAFSYMTRLMTYVTESCMELSEKRRHTCMCRPNHCILGVSLTPLASIPWFDHKTSGQTGNFVRPALPEKENIEKVLILGQGVICG